MGVIRLTAAAGSAAALDRPAAARLRTSLAAAAAALLCVAASHRAHSESLEQAMGIAYATNPQILGERANLRATDEEVPQALAGYRPTISLQTEVGRQHVENDPLNLSGSKPINDYSSTVTAQLTQPLYSGGGTVAATSAAENAVIAERATYKSIEVQVLFGVATAYYDVLRDESWLAIDREYVGALQELLGGARGAYESGALTEVDVAQAQGRLESGTAQLQTDGGQLEADRGEYEHAVGHLPDALHEPTLKLAVPVALNDVVNRAATNNPTVISDQYSERSARDQVAQSEAQLLPSINLILERNVANSTVASGGPAVGIVQNTTSAMVQLTVPFYDAGMTWSKSRQQIELVGRAQGRTDNDRRAAVQSARQAWEVMTNGRNAEKAYTNAVAADKNAVEGVRQQQLAGARTILDVLTTEQQLFLDERSLATAHHDEHVAEFNLAGQIGMLSAEDLHLNVQLYDVSNHYNSVRDKLLGLDSAK